jgi:hypothetical protein
MVIGLKDYKIVMDGTLMTRQIMERLFPLVLRITNTQPVITFIISLAASGCHDITFYPTKNLSSGP